MWSLQETDQQTLKQKLQTCLFNSNERKTWLQAFQTLQAENSKPHRCFMTDDRLYLGFHTEFNHFSRYLKQNFPEAFFISSKIFINKIIYCFISNIQRFSEWLWWKSNIFQTFRTETTRTSVGRYVVPLIFTDEFDEYWIWLSAGTIINLFNNGKKDPAMIHVRNWMWCLLANNVPAAFHS